MKIDLNFKYSDLIRKLKESAPFKPELTVILGSGLGNFADSVKKHLTISTVDLPGYPPSTIEGHSGKIHFAEVEGKSVLLFEGRIHLYEGYNIDECLLPVFISYKSGCRNIILTNAAGGTNPDFHPGDLMLAESFIALNVKKELAGLLGVASFDAKNMMTDFPSSTLNDKIRKAAASLNIRLKEGVYWYNKGPSYETPAEVRMASESGADAVGMSTAHEALFAASLGMKAAGITCITNYGAGISEEKLSHLEVTETANRVKDTFATLLKKIISLI